MTFKKHPLLYVLLPICIVATLASFYRFMVAGDYIVEYEGACDPATESCFLGCLDEDCTEPYFYTKVTKAAGDVFEQCGPDVSECDNASICLPSDSACTITYCSEDVLGENESCVASDSVELEGEEPVTEPEL